MDSRLRALRRAMRMHTNNDLLKSNAPLPQSGHFKISFESRRCCNVRERVARDCKVREKRARSCVQCKVESFEQVERLRPFCPDVPHDSRSFVLYQKARQVLYNDVSFHVSLRKRQNEVLEKKSERRFSLSTSSPARGDKTEKDQPRRLWKTPSGKGSSRYAKERLIQRQKCTPGSPHGLRGNLFREVEGVSIPQIYQRTALSSSTLICAWRRMLCKVFGARRRCAGTVRRREPRTRRICEPSCFPR
jgi:hypothetical protein